MLIFLNIILSIIIFVSGVMVFSIKRKHLLCTLLRLEFIVLRLFYLIFNYLLNYDYEIFFLIIFLVFRVCEGVLGLSILVRIVRTHGNDYFQSFNILRC